MSAKWKVEMRAQLRCLLGESTDFDVDTCRGRQCDRCSTGSTRPTGGGSLCGGRSAQHIFTSSSVTCGGLGANPTSCAERTRSCTQTPSDEMSPPSLFGWLPRSTDAEGGFTRCKLQLCTWPVPGRQVSSCTWTWPAVFEQSHLGQSGQNVYSRVPFSPAKYERRSQSPFCHSSCHSVILHACFP